MEQLHSTIIVLTILCLIILASEKLAMTRFGKGLGAALIAIVLGALLANIGIIPSASNSIDLYDHIFHYAAPLAIFFLTLGVNLNKIKKAGLPMLLLFALGSAATVLGVLIAVALIDIEALLGENAAPIAGMIAGTYTGGGINFNAIALHYNVQEQGVLFAGTVAADNIMTTIWVLATLAIPGIMVRLFPKTNAQRKIESKNVDFDESQVQKNKPNNTADLMSVMVLIPVALLALIFSEAVSSVFSFIPSILVITTVGLALAQFKYFHELSGSHLIGLYLVYLFLAVVGAYCEFSAIDNLGEIGLTILLFVVTVVLLHGVVIFSLGRLFIKDWQMLAIASQANIGGSTTAMALAETFGRKELIVPAILIGTIGNALGTYIGFSVVGIL